MTFTLCKNKKLNSTAKSPDCSFRQTEPPPSPHSSNPPLHPIYPNYLIFTKDMTTKDQILTKLKANKPEFSKFGISDIGLFGSYLRNQQTADSDIDLLIDFEPGKENFDNLMAAYDLFENIFIGEKVEVLTKNGLSKHIGSQILQNIVYV
jgi:predicted nucleotidyltransferase